MRPHGYPLRQVYIACALVCVAVVAALGAWWAYADKNPSRELPAALRSIELVDQDGHVLSGEWLDGEVLVLNFMFTSCAGACPRLTQLLSDTRSQLPIDVRERVRFLSISVDPENDTQAALKAYARRQSVDMPEWRFVRTNESGLKQLTERLTVFESGSPGTIATPSAHSLNLFLFDRRGRLLQRYSGDMVDPEHLAREIRSLDGLFKTSVFQSLYDGSRS